MFRGPGKRVKMERMLQVDGNHPPSGQEQSQAQNQASLGDAPFVLHFLDIDWQFFAEGKVVDLNCGRYCAAAAIRWWADALHISAPEDIFHKLLPEPVGKTIFDFKVAWSPGNEGKDLFQGFPKPTTLQAWARMLKEYGPIVVSGKLGLADWGFLGGADHFILILGVDVERGILFYKDPLNPTKDPLEYKFADANPRIFGTVYAVLRDALKLTLLSPH